MKFPVHHSISQIVHHSIFHLTRKYITVHHSKSQIVHHSISQTAQKQCKSNV